MQSADVTIDVHLKVTFHDDGDLLFFVDVHRSFRVRRERHEVCHDTLGEHRPDAMAATSTYRPASVGAPAARMVKYSSVSVIYAPVSTEQPPSKGQKYPISIMVVGPAERKTRLSCLYEAVQQAASIKGGGQQVASRAHS
jgi:hypothetical protein